jgi:hypothetical protein
LASTLSTLAGYVDTEVAAIKAKTDNLPAAPAAVGDIPTAGAIATQVNSTLTAAHGSGSWQEGEGGGGGFTGAYTITVHLVDEDDNPVQGFVRVSLNNDGETKRTDADGNAEFSLDAGTYGVAATAGRTLTFAPTSRTVIGDESGTLTEDLVMTAVVLPAQPDPDKANVVVDIIDASGEPVENAVVTAELVGDGPTSAGGLVQAKKVSIKTDATGRAVLPLLKTDGMVPDDREYLIAVVGAEFTTTTAVTEDIYLEVTV